MNKEEGQTLAKQIKSLQFPLSRKSIVALKRMRKDLEEEGQMEEKNERRNDKREV